VNHLISSDIFNIVPSVSSCVHSRCLPFSISTECLWILLLRSVIDRRNFAFDNIYLAADAQVGK
jgi:hypothetical protein